MLGGILAISQLFIGIFFVHNGLKLLRILDVRSLRPGHQDESLRKLTKRLMISAIGMFLFTFSVLMVFAPLFKEIWGWIGLAALAFFASYLTSIAQILAFVVIRKTRIKAFSLTPTQQGQVRMEEMKR